MAKSPPPRKRFQKTAARPPQARLWGRDELLIDRMSQEGRGIASRQGKVVFVGGALPGETVLAQCTAVKRDYDEAVMLGLVDGTRPALERSEPQCPIYRDCGGCTLQHWSLEAQQAHKQASLLALLGPIAPGLALDPAISSAPSAYRHRLRLLVQRNPDQSWLLGMRRRGSHEAVAVRHCLVANTFVNQLLETLPALLAAAPGVQGLREIEVDSDSSGQLGLCCYFAAKPGDRGLALLRDALLTGPVVALRVRLVAPRKPRPEQEWDDAGEGVAEWQELYAEGELRLRLHCPGENAGSPAQVEEMAYLPGDFTQTNWEVNSALVARALAWLRPRGDERALDLFSGIGNFALPLARRAAAVDALEGDASMTARLDANAARNGIRNIRPRTVNLMADAPVLPRADIAIVDPPRAGAKAVCEALPRTGVRRLVYVSCHPATLARDARVLQAAGFKLARAAAVDMFPHTGHSEAIALFERVSKR